MAEPRSSISTPLPGSPYSEELARGVASHSFGPELERKYLRARLMEDRTLIRVAAALVLLVGGSRGAEQILAGAWNPLELVQFGVSVVSSIVLAIVAFSPWFERVYLPLAQVIVPVRNPIIAMIVASTAAAGRLEALMLLPLLMIGPFFVYGLRFRVALVTVTISVAAYVAAGLVLGLGVPVILRSCLLLLFVAVACGIVALHLERTSRRSFLESRLIAELAARDPLTGLKNRRVFDEHLDRLWSRAVAEARGLTILLIDVDHFKAYNDRHGHQAGDHALQRVAATLQSFVKRPQDVLARYGGEEFAVILYDVEGFDAEELAEQMRRAVGALALDNTRAGTASAITISIGVAAVEPTGKRRAHGALQLADQALYRAKVQGRNRVVLLDQAAHESLQTGVFTASVASR